MSREVLILSRDAGDYLPCLHGLASRGVGLTAADTPQRALQAWRGQEVLLAQPDLLAPVLERMPGVRWVQSTWAGLRPLIELPRRDYLLTGVKGVFGQQMAEYVLGHLLERELRIPERRRRQRRCEWWAAESGTLEGRCIGVMGTGSIAQDVARIARAFGMRTRGYSRGGAPAPHFEQVYAAAQLHDFLREPDYLVGVLPDTPQTRGLLDAEAFAALRPTCVFVNIGRGSLVAEADLLAALERGQLAAAILDVFAAEPLPPDSPLWRAPGVTVTAHVSGISRVEQIARLFEANYNRWAAGEQPEFIVDFERGY